MLRKNSAGDIRTLPSNSLPLYNLYQMIDIILARPYLQDLALPKGRA
jgi:hypothetical protein